MYHLVRDKDGRLHHHSACWDLPTVGDQLLARGVDWRLYSPRWDQVGYIWNAYAAAGEIFHSPEFDRHVRPVDNVLGDIRDRNLPAVTWVTPFTSSTPRIPASF